MTMAPPRRSSNVVGPSSAATTKNNGRRKCCRLLPTLKCTFILLGSMVLAMNRMAHLKLSRSGDGRIGIGGLRRPRMLAERKPSFLGGGREDDDQEGPPYLTRTPLVVFASSHRAESLKHTLSKIFQYHPVNLRFDRKYDGPIVGSPIVISQDTDGEADDNAAAAVGDVIKTFRAKFENIGVSVFCMRHNSTNSPAATGGARRDISVHYGWALRKLFSGEAYDPSHYAASRESEEEMMEVHHIPRPPLPGRVIVLEEDVRIAPDFFPYFASLRTRLDTDESLLAVSAFHDNGKTTLVGDYKRLVRSDFFPGLGWMMPRRIWNEVGRQWPGRDWDDWLRQVDVRKGRQVIRPEVSRTFHFGGKGGVSTKRHKEHMKEILLNTKQIKWEDQDLSYLDRDAFRDRYYKRVMRAKEVDVDVDGADAEGDDGDFLSAVKESDVRLVYHNYNEFMAYAKRFGLYGDETGGILRSAYENIVDFRPFVVAGEHNNNHNDKGGKGKKKTKKTPTQYVAFIAPPLEDIRKNFEKRKTQSPHEFAKGLLLLPYLHTGDLSAFE